MRTIVISAVNLVEAGTLAILRDCLRYLSELAENRAYRVVAIVYKRELADFPNIEYVETQWPKKRWVNRLSFEYVSMKRISKEIGPVYLWFSLHDTSPNVIAERHAVYCHNPFSFYQWKFRDFFFTPKIALFALFTKYIYRINIGKNNYLVVQQDWFRQAMVEMFPVRKERVIVAPPPSSKALAQINPREAGADFNQYSFVFAASPNSHKNFECLCRAVEELEMNFKLTNFKVYITLLGTENNYARWLYRNWGRHLSCLVFSGFLAKAVLLDYYEKCNCLVFPSKVETWGLPISEFAVYNKPMLLADLPYAHETAAGSKQTAFFDPEDHQQLADYMRRLINGDTRFLGAVERQVIQKPVVYSWEDMFSTLLHGTV